MGCTIYSSIAELAQPENLSDLLKELITTTCIEPFETIGYSSTESEFLAVDRCGVNQPRYIIKRMRQERDWVMQATDDRHWRAVAIWQHGLLDRLPEEIEHGIIAISKDKEGYGFLMHNISHALLREEQPISEQDHATVLKSMAALHATFWENNILADRKLHLCTPENLFTHTSPVKAKQILKKNPSPVLEFIIEGRRLLPNFIEKDLATLSNSFAIDPTPLISALAPFPQTLVHGDFRLANMGIERNTHSKLLLLDWTRPTPTVPAFDLVYYLMDTSLIHLPIPVEQSINMYKENLANSLGSRFDESWWQPQLELSLLGVFAMMAVFRAFFAEHAEHEHRRKQERAVLQLWADQAWEGIKWLN